MPNNDEMNLTNPAPEVTEKENAPAEPKNEEPSVQDLMNQVATLKRSFDKASSEAAEYKKKWRETLSATEQASQEKAEAAAAEAERVKNLERKVAIYDLKDQFTRLGYSPDDATKAANFQYDGDTDSLFKLQAGIQAAREAQIRESVTKEIYKSIPDPKMGTTSGEDDPFLKGFNSVRTPYAK